MVISKVNKMPSHSAIIYVRSPTTMCLTGGMGGFWKLCRS